ncbi:MAG TPA: hypothetical protein VK891_09455 [Euzebyales bacterium]|nr:hypothetical protein [Euzebyales bacterium]
MVAYIDQAREAFRLHAWGDAYAHLSALDADGSLAPEDLDRLARAAYLTGRDPDCEDTWVRAHKAFLDAGEVAQAARCAFWLGLVLFNRGEEARGGGWIGRAGRLVAELGPDCVEQGYLLLPAGLGRLGAGEPGEAVELFDGALDVAERFGEPDLRALSRLGAGQALIAADEPDRAVRALDEAMVTVETGGVSTVVTGIVYCGVILQCRRLLDLRRAQEWTRVLSAWCDAQPDLVPYRGQCLVHLSELAQLRGDWQAAIAEAERVRAAVGPAGAVGDRGRALPAGGAAPAAGRVRRRRARVRPGQPSGSGAPPGAGAAALGTGSARRRGGCHPPRRRGGAGARRPCEGARRVRGHHARDR